MKRFFLSNAMSKRKMNPKSLENLEKRGRTPDWDEEKKRRYLSVTDPGFDGSLRVARSLGCVSVSDLIEKIGRGAIALQNAH
jgi:hypothetical protein